MQHIINYCSALGELRLSDGQSLRIATDLVKLDKFTVKRSTLSAASLSAFTNCRIGNYFGVAVVTNSGANTTKAQTNEHSPVEALTINRRMFLGFLVKRLGNLAEAEDVLQEFCLRVLKRKDQLRDAEKLNAWLYSILRSTLNDHYRKTGRNRRLSAAFEGEQKSTETSEVGAEEYVHICQCVRGLISTLPTDTGDLIRRIDLEDESRQSVAENLGISSGALAVRLHRARATLRDRLLGHCGCCCEHGFQDCSCPPIGCGGTDDQTHC
ncbi:RNA polymerase sigma-70 factor, ECF subfamily [Roseovarius lutimaris]|uniref:RNA polymerase sigma-70 factor, ECF subfamily n=1 Tax=Roseovarius lutimaris TaxID=1005928 RepID=A0A1I5DH65_9RHOB|nr:sigma-70 family RNA polymerase sigma factor [Roseovarius lutimaris]SFN98553.1 RNA polymerase sigma-70 factor, ECF subfamily [Roseovarius lutimaris]